MFSFKFVGRIQICRMQSDSRETVLIVFNSFQARLWWHGTCYKKRYERMESHGVNMFKEKTYNVLSVKEAKR